MSPLDARRIVMWTLAGLTAVTIATALDPVRGAIRRAFRPQRPTQQTADLPQDQTPPEKSGFQALAKGFIHSPQARPGDHHKPLRMQIDIPGVVNPPLQTRASSKLRASDPIVGVVVNGAAVAFSRATLSEPTKHIVNLQLAGKPFAVTYCDMADCTRVLTAPSDSGRVVDVHAGGVDTDDQLVLLLDGVRYGQESPDIPLKDYKFEITTWQSWTERYPDTQVYGGVE